MGIQHTHDPRQEFPLLSAFGMEGDMEDGLTPTHRPVLAAELSRRERGPRPPVDVPGPGRDEEEEDFLVWVPPTAPVHPVVRRVEGWLGRVGRCVSERVANEELGDVLERLHKLAGAGAPAWMLYAQAGVSGFWALVHTAQDATLRLFRRQRVER
jgi:hypothetical protein